LATYIQSIRDAALILRINETDTQFVQRIVEGSTPIQHARFVFQDPPFTFIQLEHLIVVDRNIMHADQTRQPSLSMGTAKAVETASTSFVSSHPRSPASTKPIRGKPVVCFYCGKTGHIQRNCFARQAQKRKQVGVAVTRS
jgi:16S rRNA G966 N2-methylase RsmD